MGFQIHVVATKQDWINLFRHVGGFDELAFYPYQTLDPDDVSRYRIDEIPDLGQTMGVSSVMSEQYIGICRNQPIAMRKVTQTDGLIRYIMLDQSINLDSFILQPGGILGEDFVILGELSSLHASGTCAMAIAKRLLGRIRSSFHRGNSFYIGPECFELYNSSRVFSFDSQHHTEKRAGINTLFEPTPRALKARWEQPGG